MTERKTTTERTEEPAWVDAPAVNPLYRGARPSEIARALLLHRYPKSDDDKDK